MAEDAGEATESAALLVPPRSSSETRAYVQEAGNVLASTASAELGEGGPASATLSWEQEAGTTSPGRRSGGPPPAEARQLRSSQEASAAALMDAKALLYLGLLRDGKVVPAAELGGVVEEPRDWLKFALLAKAEYVDVLDGSVRITGTGLEALDMIARAAAAARRSAAEPE